MKDSDGEDVEGINYIEGCRRWSQEDAMPNNKSNLADGSKNCAESENLKPDKANIGQQGAFAGSQSMTKQRKQVCAGGSLPHRDVLDLKRVNDFLRVLITNHQRTVK